jgi:hypothetical protein
LVRFDCDGRATVMARKQIVPLAIARVICKSGNLVFGIDQAELKSWSQSLMIFG